MSQDLKEMLNQLELTDGERQLVNISHTDNTASMNRSRVVSNLYLSKTIKRLTDRMASTLPEEAVRIVRTLDGVTDKIIDSNRKLAESNEKYANRMTWLTFALIIATAVQAVATVVSALSAAGIIRP
jgi:hypothetical protein